MRITIYVIIVILASAFLYSAAHAACCAWDDREACASCPEGYASGCVTEGSKCTCDCAETVNELAEKLSLGNREIQNFISKNFDEIVIQTQRQGYYRSYRYPNIRVTITPPANKRPKW